MRGVFQGPALLLGWCFVAALLVTALQVLPPPRTSRCPFSAFSSFSPLILPSLSAAA